MSPRRLFSSLFICLITLFVPTMSVGQETSDHRLIRTMLTKDQEAFSVGDGRTILDHREEHYFVAAVPRNNGISDFHGVYLGYTKDDMEERILDPEWKGFIKN